MANFDTLYAQLNTQQKRAVDTIEGPVMVMAGPGTGKTQVLAVRIANILKQTDTPPQAILALTFTDSAAANMRQRLVALIGTAGYYVRITTFHAFCSGVIQEHPEYFAIDRSAQPLTDVERFQMFEKLLLETELEHLKPLKRQLFYLRDVIKAISDLKREGVSPSDFTQIIEKEQQLFEQQAEEISKTKRNKQQKLLDKWIELQKVYALYQQALLDSKRFDYDDMIMFVKQAFAKYPDLLLEYQEQLHYFLVDEYQDTNSAQNQIVEQLASFWGEQANLFVVGDPHQSIYRFQGASIENTLAFTSQYPQAKVITLDTGYRCPQLIYDMAHQLIQHNQVEEAVEQQLADTSVRLKAASAHTVKQPVSILQAENQTTELLQITEQIKQKIDQGVPLEKIAILFRHNRDAEAVSEILQAEQINFQLGHSQNALDALLLNQVIDLLTLLVNFETGTVAELLFSVLQYEWLGLAGSLPHKLAWMASQTRQDIWQLMQLNWQQLSALEKNVLTEEEFNQINKVQTKLIAWANLQHNQLLPIALQTIFEESGLLDWIKQQPTSFELLELLATFFDFVQSLFARNRSLTLKDLIFQLQIMKEQSIELPLQKVRPATGAVCLSTVHKAKGQEWDYVYLIHAYDGKWGNARKRNVLLLPAAILEQQLNQDDENQDDRRLFYVACTRAAQQLLISYPQQLVSEGSTKQLSPSLFINESQQGDYQTSINHLDPKIDTKTLAENLAKKLQPATSYADDDQRQFLQKLVADFKLSVTALNAYLYDPQKFVEDHLLRIPQLKADNLAFGTAVHSALELLGKHALTNQQILPSEEVMTRFSTSLKQELISDEQLARWQAHGESIINDYYQNIVQSEKTFNPSQIVMVERSFSRGSQLVALEDIPLSGRIDRVDWLDKQAKQVKVIDYKTGKSKSENVIKGLTASQDLSQRERALPESIRGPMKRQLLFYKLLAELDPTFKPRVTHGVFSFIEPTKSGKNVERLFELPQSEVDDLKQLIIEVMAEIRSLSFLD